jgi:Tfp pilus assembly protein PilF
MRGEGRGRVTTRILACLGLAGCLLYSVVAPAAQPVLYDTALCARAAQGLAAGDLDGAMRAYCDMFAGHASGTLWTLSAVLLCDPAEVAPAVASIKGVEPVFVQAKLYQGKWCYRVCAGLSRDRNEPFRWRTLLPPRLLSEGPFPVPVMLPCSKSVAANTPAPAPVSPPAAAEAKPPPAPPIPEPAPLPPPAATKLPPLTSEALGKAPPAVEDPASKARKKEGEAWFQKGLAAQNAGRRSEAEDDYRRSLAADPDRPEVLNNLGVIYLQQNRFDEAKVLFAKAIARTPSYARAHLNLAGAMWGLQDRAGALMEAREAVALDPSDVSARLTLASFLLAEGLKPEAAEQARRVLLLDPENAQAKVFLTTSTGKPLEGPNP